MHDNKLIQVLRVFSTKEIKKLYEFIDSPFFTKNEKVVNLFVYLKKYTQNWESKGLQKEKVYTAIFKEKEYNSSKFNQLCFEALDMVEEFYLHLYINKEDVPSYQPLLTFYLKHNLPKHYEALFRFLVSKQDKQPKRDENYLFQQWLLDTWEAQQESLQSIRQNQEKSDDMTEGLDYFYITKKVIYLCSNLNKKNVVNHKLSNTLENEIIAYIKENKLYEKLPILRLYYSVYWMLKGEDAAEHFQLAKNILPKYNQQIHLTELQNVYTFLQNFCIKQINQTGDLSYEKQLFELYQQQIEAQLLFTNIGNIEAGTFKNIVVLGTRLAAFDWVYEFLEQNGGKLQADIQKEVVGYCQALWAFAQKMYDKTLKELQGIDPIDIFFNIDSRKLLIKTYYEMGEHEAALSTTNTFRVFIHRDNFITENHKETNRNFANIVGKLISLDNLPKIQKLRNELAEMSNVAERKWLLLQMGEREVALQKGELGKGSL